MTDNRNRTRKRRFTSNYRPPFSKDVLNQPVTSFVFKLDNTLDLLKSVNINTVGDVLIREEKDFYKIHTFNKRNLLDVKAAVQERNLRLKPTQKKQVEKVEKEDIPKQKQARPPRQKRVANKDRLIKVCRRGKWGFSLQNKIIIEPQYDEVFSFKEDLCCVEKDGLFGFINKKGEEVIPIMYQCALSFSQGLACVYKGDKCGYINKNNEVVIDFDFDAATPVEDGNCRVKRSGKWGELWIDNAKEIRWIN